MKTCGADLFNSTPKTKEKGNGCKIDEYCTSHDNRRQVIICQFDNAVSPV